MLLKTKDTDVQFIELEEVYACATRSGRSSRVCDRPLRHGDDLTHYLYSNNMSKYTELLAKY